MMLRKTKTSLPVLPVILAGLFEQFGNGPMTAEAINAATLALKKALIERALGGELTGGHGRGDGLPGQAAAWRHAWDREIAFFAFPPVVRKVIYTTNAIENVNAQLRKIIKTRGHLASDEAATKRIWLALRNITSKWSCSGHDWKTAMNQFAILYEERFVRHSA